eukprot:8861243-Ditylum_brightwellii.AAC.1
MSRGMEVSKWQTSGVRLVFWPSLFVHPLHPPAFIGSDQIKMVLPLPLQHPICRLQNDCGILIRSLRLHRR